MAEAIAGRTNDEWLAALRDSGTAGDDARHALRAVLRGGLAKSLGRRPGIDDAALDDFTQDALLRVLDKLDSYRGEARFTTWATAIALRVAFTALRRASWRDVQLSSLGARDGDGQAIEFGADINQPEDGLQRHSVLEIVRRVINDELTERQRAAIVAELEGVPQAVLAERLGVNRNALYKLTFDARRKLRAGILAAGLSEEEVRSTFDL